MARRYGKFTSRTKARKRAADILYEADQKGIVGNKAALLDLLEDRRQVTSAASPLPEYASVLVSGVAEEYNQIQHLLEARAKGSGLDRLPAVDVAVMRIAVWELLRNEDEVPPVAAIDEAVAIVKELSTDDSPAYVNAVLDAIRKDLDNPWARTAEDLSGADTKDDQADTGVPTTKITGAEMDDDLDELLGEY